jgi:dTDP-4-dehydrorhamnose reductase
MRALVTGCQGFLGPFAVAALRQRGCEVVTTARRGGDAAVDLLGPGMVDAVLEALAPDLVLHLAACSRLDGCERDPATARLVNAELPAQLARRLGSRLLAVSTDLVFDGRRAPYDEQAPVAPLSVYGATKAEGEERVLAAGGRVARLPLLFGPDAQGRGASASLRRALRDGQPVPLYTNEYRTPLHAADAAAGLAELLPLCSGPAVVHLPGPERLSRWQFGQRLCAALGLDPTPLVPVECQDPLRPRDVALVGTWRAQRSCASMLAAG